MRNTRAVRRPAWPTRLAPALVAGILALLPGACGTPKPPPAEPPAAPGPAPDPAPVVAPAPAAVVPPAGIVEAWGPFFEDRFGARPDAHRFADLDGDASADLVVHVAGSTLVFLDLSVTPPATWEVLFHDPQATPTVLDAAAARALVPDIAIQDAQQVLAFGEPAPFLVFWWGKTGELAWLPSIPASLADAEGQARAAHPGAFGISPNNRLGPDAFEGESPLTQAFVGDFDDDGAVELVVVDGATIARWTPGATAPDRQPLDYPARRGVVVRGAATVHPFPSDEASAAPQRLTGDHLSLSIPEASSIALHVVDGRWVEVWTSD